LGNSILDKKKGKREKEIKIHIREERGGIKSLSIYQGERKGGVAITGNGKDLPNLIYFHMAKQKGKKKKKNKREKEVSSLSQKKKGTDWKGGSSSDDYWKVGVGACHREGEKGGKRGKFLLGREKEPEKNKKKTALT